MTTTRRRTLYLLGALPLAVAAAVATTPSWAQQAAWPKAAPIRFVVPFTAGSGTDVIARVLAEKLAPALGAAQIVIENRPGAGGTLGAAQVAKSPADGYTFLIHSSGHVVNQALYPKLPYDTLADLEGITPLASLPNVMVAAPGRFRDVADLVAQARARPDGLQYASAGNGSATHMNAEQFRLAAGLKALHVPFRGTPEALTETIAGRVDWFFAPLVSALPLIKDGKLQALAVGTAARSQALPQVPSIVEAGFRNAAYTFWVGLFAPAKTPKAIVDRMHDEVAKALALPEVRERLDKLGATPMPMEQPAFARYLADETQAAAALVKAAGMRIE